MDLNSHQDLIKLYTRASYPLLAFLAMAFPGPDLPVLAAARFGLSTAKAAQFYSVERRYPFFGTT